MATTGHFTVAGVFRNAEQARDAIRALQQAGFGAAEISLLSRDRAQARALAEDTGAGARAEQPTEMGIPPADAGWYEQELRAGRTLVTVRAGDRYGEAWDILRRYGAYNSGSQNTTGDVRADAESKRIVELREEELIPRKEVTEAGEVEIRKEVVTEMHTMEVPVARERLVVRTTGDAEVRTEAQYGQTGGLAAALREVWLGAKRSTLFGAGVPALALAGGAAGAGWLYVRRQRERNRPLNRLRRRVRRITSDLGKGVPAGAELARYLRQRGSAGPAAGLGGMLAILGLLAAALLRGRTVADRRAGRAAPTLRSAQRDALAPAIERVRGRWGWILPLASTLIAAAPSASTEALDAVRTRVRSDRGLGGLSPRMTSVLVLGTVGSLIWLLLRARRRGDTGRPHYIGTPGVETAGGRDRSQTGEVPPEMGMEHPR